MTLPGCLLALGLLAGAATATVTVTVTAAEPPPIDRIAAWDAVENYDFSRRTLSERYSRWVHQPGNEKKTRAQAEAELGLKDPDPVPALKAALEVAQANPVDDLGFMAISFCYYTTRPLDAAARQAYAAPALQLLEQHYMNDPRLGKLTLSLARSGRAEGIAFLARVVEQSKLPALRAQAAYWSAAERLMEVDDLALPVDKRNAVRADVTRLAQLVARDYGAEKIMNQPASERIKPILYALQHLSLGSVLPDAGAQRIGGGMEKLSDYRGKVVLLDFWATWCVPCVASLPKVVKLKEELKGKPFEVITLSIDRSPDLVDKFMKERMTLPFVNWYLGESSDLYKSWGVKGVPTYFLVDARGVIHGRTHDVETLVDTIHTLVGEK